MKSDKKGVVICGAYGFGNAGDEAILTAVIREVRAIEPKADITVLSRNPEQTAREHGVRAHHMFDILGFYRALHRSRLYISGGGTLIQDVTSSRSLWYYLFTMHAAKHCGCKVLMYGSGIGPVLKTKDRLLTGKVIDRCVDAITLREPDSLRELISLGVKTPEVHLTADPALTLDPAPPAEVEKILAAAGIEKDTRCIGFALRNWKGFEEKAPLFRSAARYAFEKYGLTPVFISVEKRRDPAVGRMAAAGLSVPHCFLDDPGGPAQMIGVFGRMEAVISMRLHALIFAAGQGVPLAGVVYDPKVSSFLRYIGEDRFCDLASLTEEKLTEMTDELITVARESGRRLTAVSKLKEPEEGNREILRKMMESY